MERVLEQSFTGLLNTDSEQLSKRMSSFASDHARKLLRMQDVPVDAIPEIAMVGLPDLTTVFLEEVLRDFDREDVVRYLRDAKDEVVDVIAFPLLRSLERHLADAVNEDGKSAETPDELTSVLRDHLADAVSEADLIADEEFQESLIPEELANNVDCLMRFLDAVREEPSLEDFLVTREAASTTAVGLWANLAFLLGLLVGHLLTLTLLFLMTRCRG